MKRSYLDCKRRIARKCINRAKKLVKDSSRKGNKLSEADFKFLVRILQFVRPKAEAMGII